MSQIEDSEKRQRRWRLILGEGTENLWDSPADETWQQQAEAIDFLYRREYSSRNVRQAGTGSRGTSGKGSASSSRASSLSPARLSRSDPNTTTDANPEAISGSSPEPNASPSDSSRASADTQTEKDPPDEAPSGKHGSSVESESSDTGSEKPSNSGDSNTSDDLDSPARSLVEGTSDGRGQSSSNREGGLGASQLTVPEWINAIHELFPKKAIERLERDALERYQLQEIVTNPDLLSRAEPSPTLLKAVLHTKHLMNQEVLAIAKQLVRQTIAEIQERLAKEIRSPFLGTRDRQRRSSLKVAKNFDAQTTIRRNLSTYDPETRRLYIKTPYFFSRIRRQIDLWQLIVVVDQSGSMLDSVIHAAVSASIFYNLDRVRTHLCVFDTAIVDLTDRCGDPVETLMQVQLGGGTNIGQALSYASSLVANPRQTIIILITDFFEGAPVEYLLSVSRSLVESGVNVLGLAALDAEANPHYNRELAQKLVDLGVCVAAMTPGELAEWVAATIC